MGENESVLSILIFAAIAAFLVFQLRSVLGRRTGAERERPNPFEAPSVAPYRPGLTDPPTPSGSRTPPVIEHDPTQPLSLDARIARIQSVDPGFDEKRFLGGAKAAFQMIVGAFATGDLATLRPLLSSQLYGDLGRAISERRDRGELGPVKFEGTVGAEIIDASVQPREARIQVSFTSRQIHAGETIAPEEDTIDIWTFARDPQSRDPNWLLVETATPN